MKRRPDGKNRITKARRFPQGTVKKLESNKEVNRNSKISHKETI